MARTWLVAGLLLGCAAPRAPAAAPELPAPTVTGARSPVPAVAVAEPAHPIELHAAIAAALEPGPSEAAGEPDAPAAELEPIAPLVRSEMSEAAPAVLESSDTKRLPPETIRRVVRQSAGRFRDCYQRALLKSTAASGRVVVRFVIGGDGRVSRAEEESASLRDREARRCVLQSFFDLTFPNPTAQQIVVQYPLSFRRDGNAPLDAIPTARAAAEPPPPGFAEALRSGRRAAPPPPPVEPQPPRTRGASPSRCSDGDPLCAD